MLYMINLLCIGITFVFLLKDVYSEDLLDFLHQLYEQLFMREPSTVLLKAYFILLALMCAIGWIPYWLLMLLLWITAKSDEESE